MNGLCTKFRFNSSTNNSNSKGWQVSQVVVARGYRHFRHGPTFQVWGEAVLLAFLDVSVKLFQHLQKHWEMTNTKTSCYNTNIKLISVDPANYVVRSPTILILRHKHAFWGNPSFIFRYNLSLMWNLLVRSFIFFILEGIVVNTEGDCVWMKY